MKKALGFLLSMLMVFSLAVTGIGGWNAALSEAASPQIVVNEEINGEITYWNTIASSDEKTIDEEMIARFNEVYPNVTVKYEAMEGEAYKTKIKTVVASNNLPDVFAYWVGEQFNTLVSSGNVRDLTDLYEADPAFKDTFVGGVLDSVSVDGRIYGAPTDITCMVIWYNQKIFQENNVSVPETFEELLEVIDTLNANGVTPIAVGSKDRWPLLPWFVYLGQRIGGVELYDQVVSGDKNFTEDAYLQAGEYLRQLNQSGFMNGSLAVDSATADSLFAAGQAAMIVSGSWSIPTYTANPDTAKDFSYFAFPEVSGGVTGEQGYLYGGVANTLAMSNSTQNVAASEAFLKFAMSENERTLRCERTGSLPTVTVSPKEENMDPLAYQFSQYVSSEVQGFLPYTDQALPPQEAEKLLSALVAIIVDDSISVDAELAKVK